MCLSRTINFYLGLHILLVNLVTYVNFLLNEYDEDDDLTIKVIHGPF